MLTIGNDDFADLEQFSPEQVKILDEIRRRRLLRRRINLLESLFDKQLELINDKSPRKAALCSRRAGKTYCVVRYLAQTCLEFPNSECVYITQTRQTARDLAWKPLKDMNLEHKLDMKFNESQLKATFKNGSSIKITGVSDEGEAEKLLGHAYRLVVIDEAASIHVSMKSLIEEVLEPALEDYRGTLMLIGTPGPIMAGYFYNVTTKPEEGEWSLHKWTLVDNPMFPRWAGLPDWRAHAAELLEKKRKLHEGDPEFKRQWLGEWAAGSDEKMYHNVRECIQTGASEMRRRPGKGLQYVVGVDLGWHDSTAFSVVAYDQRAGKIYEVETIQRVGIIVDEIASIIEHLLEEYDPEQVVVDGAGEGKIIIESLAREISARYGIPLSAAKKDQKASFIRLLDSDLRVGSVVLLRNSVLWGQLDSLVWDKAFKREQEGIPCDAHDAFLYAFRECKHWSRQAESEAAPAPGSTGYWEMVERQIEEEEMQKYNDPFGEFLRKM